MLSLAGIGLLVILLAWREHTHDNHIVGLITEHQSHARALIEAHTMQVGVFTAQSAADHQRVQETLGQAHPDLTQMIELVERLCQRVQAPEQAVIDHAVAQPMPMPAHVPIDDDNAFWTRNDPATDLTTEQLAELVAMAENNL